MGKQYNEWGKIITITPYSSLVSFSVLAVNRRFRLLLLFIIIVVLDIAWNFFVIILFLFAATQTVDHKANEDDSVNKKLNENRKKVKKTHRTITPATIPIISRVLSEESPLSACIGAVAAVSFVIDPFAIPLDPFVIPLDPFVIPVDPISVPSDPVVAPSKPVVISIVD
jgi:hypothetical protein